ncbi:hypothetical protein BUALT_Bualt07G0022400 [Buddleja alternifolia]|uniref:Bet1-like protein n=1 Tax=Buddleja alternifolia TaxID=168488 RepID=A0AAV6X8G4_9LAMI|nr:hypothetical protein BUALT_Bualt07G0022400 [Buddleja alternifolia]
MADPYRSREGLSTRSAAVGGNSHEIQVQIDPDFDEEVTGLRTQVRRLRNVAQDIETEAKFQNDFLNQLLQLDYDDLFSPKSSNARLNACTSQCFKAGAHSNDIDQSSGRGEKPHEKTEQEHNRRRIEPCHARHSVCTITVFRSLFVVQILTRMMIWRKCVKLLRNGCYVERKSKELLEVPLL